MEKKYVMSWLLSGAMLLSYGTLAADDFAPKEVKFEKASYSKITLSWANSDPSRQIECYKIFRNNVEIGSSTTTSFVDATVLPGFEYVYKVQAVSVGGNVSGFSVEIPVKTMTPINFINSELVIKSTDAMHAMQGDNFNKTALLAGVKASLSALVGENILSEETELAVGELIAAEESAIRAGSDNLTAD
ncbi:MAG: fibronectin type III domain-containing protein, partial [Victivallaceae bacterium]